MSCFPRLRWNQRILTWGFVVAIAAACTPTRGGINPPPVVPDTLPREQLPESPVVVFGRPRFSAATFQLTTRTSSEDKAADIRDSAQQVRRVEVQPLRVAADGSSLRIVFHVDSILPTGTPIDSGRTYSVNADGRFSVVPAIPTCTPGVTAASTLYSRLLIARYSTTWPATDSLNYQTCIQNLRSDVMSSITWMTPVVDTAGRTWGQVVRISGQLMADSTRVLPMHLRGTLTGTVTLTYPVDTTQVSRMSGRLDFVLDASSAIRKQRIEQSILIDAIRR